MKKKKIFVNKINNRIGNNQKICKIEESDKKIELSNNDNIEEKLDKLFNTNGYIFNIKVKIITNDKEYNTRIASIVGNSIITLDNDIINIRDVKDIVF